MIENYPHRLGGHCGSGALRDLLHWAGLGWDGPPDEGLVFGLGGDLAFTYVRLRTPAPMVYFVGRGSNMELQLCRRLGIDTERRQTDDPGKGLRWVTEELDAGRPVMIWADIAELPYLRVRLSNTRHDIVVIGHNEDTAFVVDNDRADIQPVPFAALAKARNSQGFGGSNRHATYPMRFPASLPDLRTAAQGAARSALLNLRTSDLPMESALISALPDDAVHGSGLDGVEVFARDIATWPAELDPEALSAALKSLPVFIEKVGTGGGCFRKLQAAFCHDVARLTDTPAFAAAGDAYDKCAAAWSALATTAKDGTDLNAIVRAAAELPGLENAAANALDTAS